MGQPTEDSFRPEPDDLLDKLADRTTSCCRCIGNSIARSWLFVKTSSLYIWSWLTAPCCAQANGDQSRRKSNRRVGPISNEQSAKPSEISQLSCKTTDSTKQKDSKSQSNQASAPVTEKKSNKQYKPVAASSAAETSSQSSASPSPHHPQPPPPPSHHHHHHHHPHHRHHHHLNHEAPGPKVRSKEKHIPSSTDMSQKELPDSQVAPPKIEFIETGSIFGSRKRQSSSNLQLLDNGRFRSPGTPNVLSGPGGRTIRISFQTGFPSVKSVESRASISGVKTINSKKSLDPDLGSNISQSKSATSKSSLSKQSVSGSQKSQPTKSHES